VTDQPADIVPLPRRRTYLDACREQGVHQESEETRAEIFENKSIMTDRQLEISRRQGNGCAGGISSLRVGVRLDSVPHSHHFKLSFHDSTGRSPPVCRLHF
jgi:hypothetical protein